MHSRCKDPSPSQAKKIQTIQATTMDASDSQPKYGNGMVSSSS